MSIDDAYTVLGLAPNASQTEVKSAWRRLVSQWHPDRNASPEAASFIQRINAAYERIRLATVSAFAGDAGAEATPPADRRDADTDADPNAGPDAGPDAGPGRQRSHGSERDRVVQRRVRLSLEDIALGCTRVLRGRLVHTCAACDGLGQRGEPLRCTTCKGSGQLRGSEWWLSWPPKASPCTDCGGTGSRRQPCPACDGAGQQTQRYRCTVRLPAGLRDGDRLSADGGGSHRGGFDGTLELRMQVLPHPLFAVDDDGTLRCELPVDAFAWLAERWVDVPAPSGLQHMRLRRGRLAYRLPGQGLPLQRSGQQRADLLVTVTPTYPDVPDAEQLALFERLATIGESHPPAAVRTWRQKLQGWERGRG